MRTRGEVRLPSGLSAAFAVLLVLAYLLSLAPRVRAAGEAEPEPEPANGSAVQTLGSGSDTIYVARPAGAWSLYADAVNLGVVLDLLHEAGGPEHTALVALETPLTVALHGLSLEDLLGRLLEGYNFSFHYSGDRLDHVRVLGTSGGRDIRPTRRTQTLSQWTALELKPAR